MITETTQLVHFCNTLKTTCKGDEAFIAVDTEFIRRTTYWPKLCLIQVAGPTTAAIIDPQEKNLDLNPLFELLRTPYLTKVFHSARQDLEIFWKQAGFIPKPLFDTQVAAMFCGYNEVISYETMIFNLIGEKIDKSASVSDWSQRPLTTQQIEYALADVTYLRLAYKHFKEHLYHLNRLDWLAEEMTELANPALYEINPETCWVKYYKEAPRDPKYWALIRDLLVWREKISQQEDLARGRIFMDDWIGIIARGSPHSPKELRKLIRWTMKPRFAREIITIVENNQTSEPESWPKLPELIVRPVFMDLLMKDFKNLVRETCERYHISPKLLTNAHDLRQIVYNASAPVAPLKGWRRKIFGEEALRIRAHYFEKHQGLPPNKNLILPEVELCNL